MAGVRFVALLRGINVGKAKRVAMADLRALVTDLGGQDVRTHLNSGNVVFTDPSISRATEKAEQAWAQRIEADVLSELQVRCGCLVRSAAAVTRVVEEDPFGELADNGSRYLALLLSTQPDVTAAGTLPVVADNADTVRLGHRVVYQWCPEGVLKAAPVATTMEKQLGLVATGRNWNTMLALQKLLG